MEVRPPEDECDSMDMTQQGEELKETNDSRYVTGRKRTLVEIFAVLLLGKEDTNGVNPILQENLVLAADKLDGSYDSVLCAISGGKPMQTDSQNYLILTGPHCGLEVNNYFTVAPFYLPKTGTTGSCLLWARHHDNSDIFTSRWVETRNGFMVVKFAVNSDGLEAQLEVTMSDLELLRMPLDVYGTVTTSNSAFPHSEAKSCLFNHSRVYCAMPDRAPSAKAEILLPLSRSVTVIPRKSNLIVDLNLFLRCASGDISIANESVSFDARTRSDTVQEHVIKCSYVKLKVKVTWIEALEYGREEEEGKKEAVENDKVTEDEEEVTDD